MAEYGPPRNITESMATRQSQQTIEQPERRLRHPTAQHTLDYSDVNEKTSRQRFFSSASERTMPPHVGDISNAKPLYKMIPPRNTNVLEPKYRGYTGKVIEGPVAKVPAPGHAYSRKDGENYSLRTDDIDRCFADAFHHKYGAYATRPSNRIDDIFGAQHDTKCREPQVWRSSGPYVDPGNRHFPEHLATKRTNRVDDIEGAQPAASRAPAPLRRFHQKQAVEAALLESVPLHVRD